MPSASRAAASGDAAEQPLPPLRDAPVGTRQHPGGRALEQVKPGDLLLDLGDELDRRRAGADHGHATAAQIEPVVPPRRVERAALEPSEPRQVGRDRVAQRTAGEHEHIGGEGPACGCDPPVLLPSSHSRRPHLVVEADVRQQAELARAALQVRPDLRLPGEPAAPSRFERERERVQVRLDVAGAARDRCCHARCRRRRRLAPAPRSRGCPRASTGWRRQDRRSRCR